MLEYNRPYHLYAFAALIGFGLQGLVSNTGALTVVLPNLPFPIPYINGRTFHANIGMYWSFLGLLGGVFYFFREEIEKQEMTKFINVLFLLLAGLMFALQGSLVLRYPVGREYIEGPWLIRAALIVPLLLLVYCLTRLYRLQPDTPKRTALFCIITGSILLLFSFVTVVIFYQFSPLEQLSQFLVFHVLSEMGAELIAIALICLLASQITEISLTSLETVLYVSLFMAASAAAMTILEYYIWPGVFSVLLLMGLAFSGLHVIPLLTLLYQLAREANMQQLIQVGRRKMLSLMLLSASIFYHLFAAGLVGLLLAYPSINRYLHNTYAASAHSHQALFGVFGSLAVALAVYILFESVELSATDSKAMMFGIIVFNSGMLIMGIMLLAAGGLSVYFTIASFDQMTINQLLRPYLLARVAGGVLYTTGSLVFCGMAFRRLWLQRRVFIGVSDDERETFQYIQEEYSKLIGRQREVKAELTKVLQLYRALFPPKRKQ